MPKHILIVGAGSDMAQAIARKLAVDDARLTLAARDTRAVEAFAQDLEVRSQQPVELLKLDVLEFESADQMATTIDPLPDLVVCAVGYLGDQEKAQSDSQEALTIINTNFVGVSALISTVANRMQKRGSGSLVVIGSVAGDRGRASNYVYGSAKAGLSAFLSGLRNRLHVHGVHVLEVRPGFVDTSMTANMDLPAALTAQPDEVADVVVAAIRKKRDIIYVKWFWRWIMLVIRSIPEAVFKRLSL